MPTRLPRVLLFLLYSFLPLLLLQLPNTALCIRNTPASLVNSTMLNVTAMKGDNVEFRCKVHDIGKHTVAFFRDEIPPRLLAFDESVFRQPDKYQLVPRQNGDEWVLRVRNVEESDAGGYTCQLNSSPVLTRTAYLQLKVPPSISRSATPSAVEVREGHNVTLTCEADGNPKPTVLWRRQDRQIIRYNGANGYGESVYRGPSLKLSRVNRKHMSEYVCVASNGIPPDESWTIKLHVLFEPSVFPQDVMVEAPLDSLARLVCNVEAWPRPTVTWYLDGVELYDSARYSTEQGVVDRYRSVHVLELREVEPDQYGIYRCVAANDYGRHFADIRLVEVPPYDNNLGISLMEGSADFPHSPDDEDSLWDSGEGFNDPDEDDNRFVLYEVVKPRRGRRILRLLRGVFMTKSLCLLSVAASATASVLQLSSYS